MTKKLTALICILALGLCITACKNEEAQETTLTGMVVSVDGTVISLREMEASGEGRGNGERPEGMPEGFNPGNFGGSMPEGFDPESFDGTLPEDFDPESFSGEMPEGFENFAGFSGMTGNFDVSSLTFGTETKIYIIPESLKIGDGDYTSLKAGDVIMIMLDDNDSVTSVSVIN